MHTSMLTEFSHKWDQISTSAKHRTDRKAKQWAYWRDWIVPRFLDACQRAGQAELEQWLTAEEGSTEEAILTFDPEPYGVFLMQQTPRACLRTALLINQEGQWTAEEDRKALASSASSTLVSIETGWNVSPGQVIELVHTLLNQPISESHNRQVLQVLLVNPSTGYGRVARLVLTLRPGGTGALYPVAEQMFLLQDKAFRQSIKLAETQAHTLGLWPASIDVCWGLMDADRDAWMRSVMLTGGSMGAAWSLGLAKLLVDYYADSVFEEDSWQAQLASADLAAVTATAALGNEGNWQRVEGVWGKLGNEALTQVQRQLLRWVIVSDDQELGLLDVYETPGHGPLQVLRANGLESAVRALSTAQGPRQAIKQLVHQQCAMIGEEEMLGYALPIATHYQILPLLKEVEHTELPKDEEAGDEPTRLKSMRLNRWEEQAQHRTSAHLESKALEPTLLETLNTDKGPLHWVVLGGPGNGKSTLLQYIAWSSSYSPGPKTPWPDLLSKDLLKTLSRWLPIRVHLVEWQASGDTLPTFLTNKYRKEIKSPINAPTWEHWLERGDVLLLLDGLDEIDQSWVSSIKQALIQFKKCPTILTCRTISFERHRQLCPDWPVFELGELDRNQQEHFVTLFSTVASADFNSVALITQIREHAHLDLLTVQPLLLHILCVTADQVDNISWVTTRGNLYGQVIKYLLKRRKPPQNLGPKLEQLLQVAALVLFAGNDQKERQLAFTEAALYVALEEAATLIFGESSGRLSIYKEIVQPISNWLVSNRGGGLLQQRRDGRFFFLHLTFYEFLAASGLAVLINKDEMGWSSEHVIGQQRVYLRDFVDRKAWDYNWWELIALLGGQLDSPSPLLELLSDPAADDFLRHRLALTALCLQEIPPETIHRMKPHVDKLTSDTFQVWWQHRLRSTEEAVPHLLRALEALYPFNGTITFSEQEVELPFQDLMTQLLGSKVHLRSALKIWERIATSGVAIEVIGSLSQWLETSENYNSYERTAVLEAILKIMGRVGKQAATPNIINRILPFLDSKSDTLTVAMNFFIYLGDASFTPRIVDLFLSVIFYSQDGTKILDRLGNDTKQKLIERICQRLDDPDEDLCALMENIEKLGDEAAVPKILHRLPSLLQHQNEDVRKRVFRVIMYLKDKALTQDIVDLIFEMIGNDDPATFWNVREIIQRLGSKSKPILLQRISQILGGPVDGLQLGALEVLSHFGNKQMSPEILDKLALLLGSANAHLRKVIDAVGALGNRAAVPLILDRLQHLLKKENLQSDCLFAIGRLGEKAATPEITDQISHLLINSANSNYPPEILQTTIKLGQQAILKVSERISQELDDPNKELHLRALKVLSILGDERIATSEILDKLALLLNSTDEERLEVVLKTIGALGSNAAVPAILNQFPRLLNHEEFSTRNMAVDTIGKMGEKAATKEILNIFPSLMIRDMNEGWNTLVARIGTLGNISSLIEDYHYKHTEWYRWTRWGPGLPSLNTLTKLGSAAATPEILSQLEIYWNDANDAAENACVKIRERLECKFGSTKEFRDLFSEIWEDNNYWIQVFTAQAIVQVESKIEISDYLDRLFQFLEHDDNRVQYIALNALRALDADVIADTINERTINQLIQLLDKASDNACSNPHGIIEAVGIFGERVATPEIIDRLAQCLKHPELDVQRIIWETIGQWGSKVARPEIINQFSPLIDEEILGINSDIKREYLLAALRTLGKIGKPAATASVLEGLARLLDYEKLDRLLDYEAEAVRNETVALIGKLGTNAATPRILIQLARLFEEHGYTIAETLGQALEGLLSTTPTKQWLEGLTLFLMRENYYSFELMKKVQNPAAIQYVSNSLYQILSHKDEEMQEKAAHQIGKLTIEFPSQTLLDQFALLLIHENESVRYTALDFLGKIQTTPITQEILDKFPTLLNYDDSYLRHVAAETLSSLVIPDLLMFKKASGGIAFENRSV